MVECGLFHHQDNSNHYIQSWTNGHRVGRDSGDYQVLGNLSR